MQKTTIAEQRHLPTRPKWKRNERKVLVLIAMESLENCTINELHAYLHQIGRENEFIARSTLEKLVTRYRLNGLLKREKNIRTFHSPNRTWKGFEYKYSLTKKGINRMIWLLQNQKCSLDPLRKAQQTPSQKQITINDLLLLYLKLQEKKRQIAELEAYNHPNKELEAPEEQQNDNSG